MVLIYEPNTNIIENREIFDELALNICLEDLHVPTTLNLEQLIAYLTIIDWIDFGASCVFFIDGPRGTRKTFLYHALLATITSRQMIVIAIATSGVTSSIMLDGHTSHSKFKISMNVDDSKFVQHKQTKWNNKIIKKS